MNTTPIDTVTPFLAAHGIIAGTACLGRSDVVIGRRICLPALVLVYRQEGGELIVCDLAAGVQGGAVRAFLQLVRMLAAGVPQLQRIRGLFLERVSDPALNRARARLARILEAKGARWQFVAGDGWLVYTLPGKGPDQCR